MSPDTRALAQAAVAVLAAVAKARTMAEEAVAKAGSKGPQFEPEFKSQLQHISELLERFVEQRTRSSVAIKDGRDLTDILASALESLAIAVRHGNLDFAEGSVLLTYHVQHAEAGNYNSACWLRDNLIAADKAGRPVPHYVRFLMQKWRKGGLRKSMRIKGRGKRGAALGAHHQLLLAREVWKHRELARCLETAIDKVATTFKVSRHSARNAYYRFQCDPLARGLYFELTRDLDDDATGWLALARSEFRLRDAKRALQRLSPALKRKDTQPH